MVSDKNRRHLPPYISYRTFRNFIEGLQQQMPSRIDRSYWGELLSGSNGTQLMAAMRFLRLLDDNGRPTSQLKNLVATRGGQRAAFLKGIAAEAFDFILESPLDLPSATYAQLEELFSDTFQLADDVRRKCIKYFIEFANDAGIPLSPFIHKRFRSSRTTTAGKTSLKRISGRTNRNAVMPQELLEVPEQVNWNKLLLTKFPTFDPSWTDEVKLKWFEAFDQLLKRSTSHDGT